MKQPYETPMLAEYGSIAECTFAHPRHRPGWGWDTDEAPGSGALPT
jgi:hypothetical protein